MSDGIGLEVVPEGMRVLQKAGSRFGRSFRFDEQDWSCARYGKAGAFMPADGLENIARHDVIFPSALGWPTVPDHPRLWDLLVPIRRFDQYVNLRPVRLFGDILSGLGHAEASRAIVEAI